MFLHLMVLNIKARMQYGRSFIYDMFTQIMVYVFEILIVWILLSRFELPGGWGFNEVLFLFGLGYFARAVECAFVWDPMLKMSDYVKEGTLDKFLTAPVNTFVYLIGTDFSVWPLAHVFFSLIVTFFAGGSIGVTWAAANIFWVSLAAIGGAFIYTAFIILGGALAFWIIKSQVLIWMFVDTISLINYPVSIYPKAIQYILSYVIPIALANYFPTVFILNKGNINSLSMTLIFLVGFLLFCISYRFWWFGLKRYQSAGN